jgi:uncharacterized protein
MARLFRGGSVYVATVDIGPEGLDIDRTLDPAAVLDRGLEPEPIHLAGRVRRAGGGFGCRGRLRTAVRLPCSRCAEPYRLELNLAFDLIYREPAAVPAAGGQAVSGAPEPDDPEVCALDDGCIDLAQLAREQIYLELPLKPLCREDCAGLCPQCGARRDDGPCGCASGSGDPRWAALRVWKGQA